MNYRTLHLEPGANEAAGGGAAGAGAPAAGAAAPAFDPAAFKTEITGLIQSGLNNGLGSFRREFESKYAAPRNDRNDRGDEDKAPTMQQFFNSKGEMDEEGFAKYFQAQHKHLSKAEKAEWEKEYQDKQGKLESESSFRKTRNEHLTREAEYSKANPSYQQDIMAAGDMEVNPRVGRRILSSPYSANIIHHFAKNRSDFQSFQALSYDDPEGALEMIGELGYQFKATNTAANKGLPAKPTKAGFGTLGSKTATQRSNSEIIADWRG